MDEHKSAASSLQEISSQMSQKHEPMLFSLPVSPYCEHVAGSMGSCSIHPALSHEVSRNDEPKNHLPLNERNYLEVASQHDYKKAYFPDKIRIALVKNR